MLIVFQNTFILFIFAPTNNGLLRKRSGNRTQLIIYSMNKILLLLLDLLKTAKTKLGKVILIVLIMLGLVYLCFATSCCSVTSSTHFSVDSAKVSNLDYHKNDSVNFQKFF